MKYIYEHGARTFRGYFFWNRIPVEVSDRATLEAIKRESGFTPVEDEKPRKAVEEPESLSQRIRTRLSLPKKGNAA